MVKVGETFLIVAAFHDPTTGDEKDPTSPAAKYRTPSGTWTATSAPSKQDSQDGLYGVAVDTTGFAVGDYAYEIHGTVATGVVQRATGHFEVRNWTTDDIAGSGFNASTDTLEDIRDAIDSIPSSTGMPTCYFPSSATRTTGTNEGGVVGDLASRDGVYYSTGEVNSSTLLEVLLTRATSDITETPSLVQMRGRYEGGAGHQITAAAWNFITSAWDNKSTFGTKTEDFDYTFSLNDNEEYHDAATGEMRFRFQHSAGTGIVTHRLHIDYFCFQKQGTDSVLESNVAAIKSVTDNLSLTFYSGTYYLKGDTGLWNSSVTPIAYLDAAISSRSTFNSASDTVTLKSGTHTGAVIPTVTTTENVTNPVTVAGITENSTKMIEQVRQLTEKIKKILLERGLWR